LCVFIFNKGQEYYITVMDYPWKTTPIDIVAQGTVSASGPGWASVTFTYAGSAMVQASTMGPCGPVYARQQMTVVDNGFSRIGESDYSYYPNPVSDNLTIASDPSIPTATKGLVAQAATSMINIKLLDSSGNVVRDITIEDGSSTTVDTVDLPNGLYYLNLSTGSNAYSQLIAISH
jgi:hypothetical protein